MHIVNLQIDELIYNFNIFIAIQIIAAKKVLHKQ